MLYFLQFNRLTNSLSLLSYSDCIQYGKVSIYFTTLTQFTSDSINRSYLLTLDIRCKTEGIFLHRKTKTQIIFISSANKKLYVCCNFFSWRIAVGGVKIRNQINSAHFFLPFECPNISITRDWIPKNIMLQNITVECTSENLIKNNFVSSSQLAQQLTQFEITWKVIVVYIRKFRSPYCQSETTVFPKFNKYKYKVV